MPRNSTYSNDPGLNTESYVRFLIGDTDVQCPLFDDKEIAFIVSKFPNPFIASAELLEAKATEFTRQADLKVGEVSKSFSAVSEAMFNAACKYREKATRAARPFFGGLTHSGKLALDQDIDAVQPWARIDLNDNPEAVQLNNAISSFFGAVGPF